MSIYSVLDIFGFVFVLYCIITNKAKMSKFCFVYLLLWTLLVSFRGYGVGNDTSGYAYFFSKELYPSLNFCNYGTIDDPAEEIEGGFVWFAKILSIFSKSPTLLFGVIAIIFFSAIYQFYKNEKYGGLGLLWLFTSTYSMMNIMYVERQCLSLGLLFWGILICEKALGNFYMYKNLKNSVSVLKNKRALTGLGLVVLSLTIHRSSIIALILYIAVRFIRFNKIGATIAVFSCYVLSLTSISTIQQYFDAFFVLLGGISWNNLEILMRYQNSMQVSNVSFLNLTSFALPCLITILYSSKNEIQKHSFKLYVVAICLYTLFSSSPFMARFTVFFLILGYPSAIPCEMKKDKAIYLFFLLMTCFYLWKMVNQYANWPINISSDLPYKFVWE